MTEATVTRSFAVQSPTESSLFKKVEGYQDQISRVVICDDDSFSRGGTLIKAVRSLKKDVELERRAIVDPLNEEVKLINARFKEKTNMLDGVIKSVQPKLDSYLAEKERERQKQIAEERKLREEEALRRAEELEAQGASEASELALTQGTSKTIAERQKLSATSEYGVTTSGTVNWSGEEANKREILKAVLDGVIDIDAVSISKAALNAFARNKQEEGVFHGIKVVRSLKAVAR